MLFFFRDTVENRSIEMATERGVEVHLYGVLPDDIGTFATKGGVRLPQTHELCLYHDGRNCGLCALVSLFSSWIPRNRFNSMLP